MISDTSKSNMHFYEDQSADEDDGPSAENEGLSYGIFRSASTSSLEVEFNSVSDEEYYVSSAEETNSVVQDIEVSSTTMSSGKTEN